MKLFSLAGNVFKLDRCAMFGNEPKAVWEKWMPVDGQNRMCLAMRTLLAVTGKHAILLNTGVGAVIEPKLRERFNIDEPEHILLKSPGKRINLERMKITQATGAPILVSNCPFCLPMVEDGIKTGGSE